MSKSKKYNDRYVDREYMDGGRYNDVDRVANQARLKEKRLNRALKTKNVDLLVDMEDEGLDHIDYEYDLEDNIEYMKVQWK
jgi:hypothetical protein